MKTVDDFKTTITVGESDYEAVVEDGLVNENCCSNCSLNNKCLSNSKLCKLCLFLQDVNPGCGVYFIEKNVADGW